MALSYELARRHYQIERLLELEPGTRGFGQAAEWVHPLPTALLQALFAHSPTTYALLIPLCLLARRLHGLPEQLDASLSQALNQAFSAFSAPLVQEQERLIHDEKLAHYLYARTVLLEELRDHQHWSRQQSALGDRDLFRQYLSGYVQLLHSGLGHPHLLRIWNDTGWLQRWQLDSTPVYQAMPVQSTPRYQIGRYQFHEPAQRLYAQLDQGVINAETFLQALPEAISMYLNGTILDLNTGLEQRLRDITQVVMRHGVKKMFRMDVLSKHLLLASWETLSPSTPAAGQLLIYTLIQELLLGTQNLKYRLNDALHGSSEALALLSTYPHAEERWHWAQHAVLDGVMEIYESFNLADSALKAFHDHYQQALGQLRHQRYQASAERLAGLFQA